jgi:hypothetical protein
MQEVNARTADIYGVVEKKARNNPEVVAIAAEDVSFFKLEIF